MAFLYSIISIMLSDIYYSYTLLFIVYCFLFFN
ncbi:hypothetical protein SAMN05421738_1372 [Algoriella xinjiangensis]|uniref:Uncharacterized protein n=1 Tax=Algoriella xinjiangensis TaxID=684065 RepID=A0A1I5BJL7_9FLAO|nr:hypothetical protein SAMN05421738_1372 [Algoriella xinjiangensis]